MVEDGRGNRVVERTGPAGPGGPPRANASRAAAQLAALLPAVPVERVFRTTDGGQSWTPCDLGVLLHAIAADPGH
jgi:hypothetical protein